MSASKIITHMQLWLRALRGVPAHKLRYGGRPKPRYYTASGGPLNGKTLLLVDGTTAPLRIGTNRGQYRCGLVGTRWASAPGTTVWKPLT